MGVVLTVYIYIAAVAAPCLIFWWIRHWWKVFDRPNPPTFEAAVWGFSAGVLTAIIWPILLLPTAIWGICQLMMKKKST